jgi:uncharacterized protein
LVEPSTLVVEIAQIPSEGCDLDVRLEPAAVHVESETEFTLRAGGRLVCHLDLVDGDTVHVRGHLSGPLDVDCSRCLDPIPFGIEQELDLFYLRRRVDLPAQQEEEDVELDDRDVVVGYYEGDRLDLGEVVREQLFLALPLKRLCREECRGLCPTCGRNRNVTDCACPAPEEPEDPRLAVLRKLIDPDRH